jgi:TonB family protein
VAIYALNRKGRISHAPAPIGDNLLFLGYFLGALIPVVFHNWARSVTQLDFGEGSPLEPFLISALFAAVLAIVIIVSLEIISRVKLARLGARPFPNHKAPFFIDILNREVKSFGFSRPPKTYWLPAVYPIGARVFGGFSSKLVMTGGLFAAVSRSDGPALYVLRHEISHIKNRDTLLYVAVLPAFIAPLLLLLDLRWETFGGLLANLGIIFLATAYLLRRREYLADAAAMNASTSRDTVKEFLAKAARNENGWFHPSVKRRLKALNVGSPVLGTSLGLLGTSAFLGLASVIQLAIYFQSLSVEGRYLSGYLLMKLLFFSVTVLPFITFAFELSKGMSKKLPATSSEPSISNDNVEAVAALCFGTTSWWTIGLSIRILNLLQLANRHDAELFRAIELGAVAAALVATVWLVAAFGLLRRLAWARGLVIGLALLSIIWHSFEITRGRDLSLFGSYGERSLHEEILALVVFLLAFVSAVVSIGMLMGKRTRMALASPHAKWKVALGLGGALTTGLVVSAMAASELGVVSKMNQRPLLVPGEITHPVIAEVPEDPPITVSEGLATGLLITRRQPIYPDTARNAKISGDVVVAVVIGKTGDVQNARLVSGHPLLAPSAIEAVKTWKFKPYVLNDEPVRYETNLHLHFSDRADRN